MFIFVAFFFVFGQLVFAAEDRVCGCNELRDCIQEKKAQQYATWGMCHDKCAEMLGDKASGVGVCFNEKLKAKHELKKKLMACVYKPENKFCKSDDPRVKRHAMFEANSPWKSFFPAEMDDFQKCLHDCVHEMEGDEHGNHNGGHAAKKRQARDDQNPRWRRHQDFVKRIATECTDEMICSVDHAQMKSVWDKCKNDAGGHEEFRKVYENFCICLRKAYGKTAQELPCIVPNFEHHGETKSNNGQSNNGQANIGQEDESENNKE